MLNQYGIPVKDYNQNRDSYRRQKYVHQANLLSKFIVTRRTNIRRTRQRTDVERQWGFKEYGRSSCLKAEGQKF